MKHFASAGGKANVIAVVNCGFSVGYREALPRHSIMGEELEDGPPEK
jgi:hypothetical protein